MLAEKISTLNNVDHVNFQKKHQGADNIQPKDIEVFKNNIDLLNTLATFGIINKNALDRAKVDIAKSLLK